MSKFTPQATYRLSWRSAHLRAARAVAEAAAIGVAVGLTFKLLRMVATVAAGSPL